MSIIKVDYGEISGSRSIVRIRQKHATLDSTSLLIEIYINDVQILSETLTVGSYGGVFDITRTFTVDGQEITWRTYSDAWNRNYYTYYLTRNGITEDFQILARSTGDAVPTVNGVYDNSYYLF